MSRIRTIKPEFWTSEQVLECSTNARLLFLGLWNFCDDAGRHPYSAKQAKAEVFPADDFSEVDVLGMLNELSENGLIARYVSGGKEYFYVTGWKHQRIDKPQTPKYPDPFAEDSASVPRTIPPDTIRKDRKGKKSVGSVATRPTDTDFEDFKRAYPKRKGANPWHVARTAFDAAIKSGVEPATILAALKAGTGFDPDKIGTEFIPRASTWLRERRYGDHQPATATSTTTITPASPSWTAWKAHYRDNNLNFSAGHMDRCAADGKPFTVPSEWPPGHRVAA